jgi:hypothetical protein
LSQSAAFSRAQARPKATSAVSGIGSITAARLRHPRPAVEATSITATPRAMRGGMRYVS